MAYKFMLAPSEACYFNISSNVTGGVKGTFQLNEKRGDLGLMLIEGFWNQATTKLDSKVAHSLPSTTSGQIPVDSDKLY